MLDLKHQDHLKCGPEMNFGEPHFTIDLNAESGLGSLDFSVIQDLVQHMN